MPCFRLLRMRLWQTCHFHALAVPLREGGSSRYTAQEPLSRRTGVMADARDVRDATHATPLTYWPVGLVPLGLLVGGNQR